MSDLEALRAEVERQKTRREYWFWWCQEARAARARMAGELADEQVQSAAAHVLYLAALRHVEGERDRARATAVRLEQLLAVASSEFEGVGL